MEPLLSTPWQHHCVPLLQCLSLELQKLPAALHACMQAPVLLRLVFHDAGTFLQSAGNGGANASIRFELKRPENTGLNRYQLIQAFELHCSL